MHLSLIFTRILFGIVSTFFMTIYMLTLPTGTPFRNGLIGILIGVGFTLLLYGFDHLFRRFTLRAFNIAVVGLFIGFLMGLALSYIFDAVIDISSISIVVAPQMIEIIHIALFLFGTYLGTIMTLRSSDELYISIPFVKLSPSAKGKRDLILDASALGDARLIDLCTTGLLNDQLIIPRFVLKELHSDAESTDEEAQRRALHSLEVVSRLESLADLGVRLNETDFPDVADQTQKLLRLARLIDANLLSAKLSKAQLPAIEGIAIINIHTLSHALKPLSEAGEVIHMKVQRIGKEPNQGVGYLEDGTMVVINGGGSHVGRTISCHVLSVKHTASGRIVFCNAADSHGTRN